MLIDVDISSMFLSKFLDSPKKTLEKPVPEEKPAPVPAPEPSSDSDLESLLEPVAQPATKTAAVPTVKKKKLFERLKSLHDDKCEAVAGVECYDAGVHGALVDLTWNPVPRTLRSSRSIP